MSKVPVLLLIVSGTVLGLMGTDLVLPAIPSLPEALGGSLAQAQWVLAAFAAGTALGLLVFGALGANLEHRRLLVIGLIGYAITSWLATLATTMTDLVALRFSQGALAAAPAVFAPAMIRRLLDEQHAVRAMGVMGSLESLAPALAPALGALLLHYADWRISFYVIATVAAILIVGWLTLGRTVPDSIPIQNRGGYFSLLKNPVFLRYSLSQAATLGGLLIFVFGAPSVFVNVMGGTLNDFVIMQVTGISFFILCANLADRFVAKFGAESIIAFGSLLSTGGFVLLLLYSMIGSSEFWPIWCLFILANAGLGLRGPPGFFRAILASGDDDARGAALVILFFLLVVALGTVAVAPLIELGLVPLLTVATAISAMSPMLLRTLPALKDS